MTIDQTMIVRPFVWAYVVLGNIPDGGGGKNGNLLVQIFDEILKKEREKTKEHF